MTTSVAALLLAHLALSGRAPAPSRAELPAGLRAELRAIAAAGRSAQMPTVAEMLAAGRPDLVALSRRVGGQSALAARLRLRVARGRRRAAGARAGESEEEARARVGRALLAFAAANGEPARMPTLSEMQSCGEHALLWALRTKFGGMRRAAAQLGLDTARTAAGAPTARAPRGYWRSFENVRRELLAFVEAHGAAGEMPTGALLRAEGRRDLGHAVDAHGGLHAVAQRLGLRMAHGRSPARHWADPHTLVRALAAFAREHGTEGAMPTVLELQRAGRHDLARAVGVHHGGRLKLARQTGLHYSPTRTPHGYWQDEPSIHAELLAFVAANGTAGVMPSRLELLASGARTVRLLRAIEERCGGLVAVARATGLHVPPERFGVWVIDTTDGQPFVRGGKWQRQVATVDAEAIVGRGSMRRRVGRDGDHGAAADDEGGLDAT